MNLKLKNLQQTPSIQQAPSKMHATEGLETKGNKETDAILATTEHKIHEEDKIAKETKDENEKKQSAEKPTVPTTIADLPAELQEFLLEDHFPLGTLNTAIVFQPTDSINTMVGGFTPIMHLIGNGMYDYANTLLNCPDIELHHISGGTDFYNRGRTTLSFLLQSYCIAGLYRNVVDTNNPYFENTFHMIKRLISLYPRAIHHMPPHGVCKGYTDLYGVAVSGNLECLKLMHQYGGNINFPNQDGSTPLFGAAGNRHTHVVEFLLQQGADIDVCATVSKGGTYQSTALHHCVYVGRSIECAALLLAAGHKYNIPDLRGLTPFGITQIDPDDFPSNLYLNPDDSVQTAAVNRKQIAEMLQVIDNFFTATANGDIKQAQELLEAGVPVNARNVHGQTPLHIACQTKFPEMTCLLLQNGAKLTVLDNNKQTSLDLASQNSGFKKHSSHVAILMNVIQDMINEQVLYWKQKFLLSDPSKLKCSPNAIFEQIFLLCEEVPQFKFANTNVGRRFICMAIQKAIRSNEIQKAAERGYTAFKEGIHLSSKEAQLTWLKNYKEKMRLMPQNPSLAQNSVWISKGASSLPLK